MTGSLLTTRSTIRRPAEISGLFRWPASPRRIRLSARRPTSTTARSRPTDGGWRPSNETGAYGVYAKSFPATGFRRQISTQGGFEPHWRRDGTELFYLAPNQTLMAVGVTTNPTTLEVSPPKALFATQIKWMEIQAGARHSAPLPMVNAS